MTIAPPAPWTLHGRGFVATYALRRDAWRGREPVDAIDPVRGRLALVMLVEYADSPVGPYRELLVAMVRNGRATIPRIVVDSEASVAGGNANWAIPKVLGAIDVAPTGTGERWRVEVDGRTWLDATVRPRGPAVPVTLGLLPRPLRALRQWRDGWLRCPMDGAGRASLARWDLTDHDPEAFVDLAGARLLGATAVSRFTLRFDVARPLVG